MRDQPDQKMLMRAGAALVQRPLSLRAALLAGVDGDAVTSASVIERAYPSGGNDNARTDHE